jgi:hypothetical protein
VTSSPCHKALPVPSTRTCWLLQRLAGLAPAARPPCFPLPVTGTDGIVVDLPPFPGSSFPAMGYDIGRWWWLGVTWVAPACFLFFRDRSFGVMGAPCTLQ